MKRRHMITLAVTLGLAVLLTVTLFAAFAGPAGAATGPTGKRVDFKATSDMMAATKDGTPSIESKDWVCTHVYNGPDGISSFGGMLREGHDFLSADRRWIPFLTGYSQIRRDWVRKVDDTGKILWGYFYESGTLYVGCDTMADVTNDTPVWRCFSFGSSGLDGIEHAAGVNYGIAGSVKGWEAYWTMTRPLLTNHPYGSSPQITGYYVTN